MAEIKNVIFDLGGVIINLDYNRTRESFIALGVRDFDSIYSKAQQSGFFDEFDKGNLSPEEFRHEIRKHISHQVSDDAIDAAWDAMLLDIPKEKLDLLMHLKNQYRTFLLSNTNKIHVKNFSGYMQQAYGTPDFTPYFEKWYFSCNIGMRKPDAEVFHYVLSENNLKPTETLFIDDSIQHVEGAKNIGLQTLFLMQNYPLKQALENAGVRF